MNDTLNAILRKIITEPDEDLHRLVYADALEERGEVLDKDSAHQIRVSVQNPDRIGGWSIDGIHFSWGRGFVKGITCSAQTFLEHADELLWHPSQVVKTTENCIHCKGRGRLGRVKCDRCVDGKRTVETPRPCPDTAQPIRKVVFTTEPSSTGKINHFALWKKMERGEPWRSYRWPGVEFVMPEEHTEYDAEDSEYAGDEEYAGPIDSEDM